ncbi:hypothetical protein [Methyloglobulus sp.]|uniref:hypothetical protein n=1 Tax=Methyloglobulus sp. TaxID=2518622 RepID=UPI0032B85BFA
MSIIPLIVALGSPSVKAAHYEGVHGSVVSMQGHPTRRQVIWAVVMHSVPKGSCAS